MPIKLYNIKTEGDFTRLKKGIASNYLVVKGGADFDQFDLDNGSLIIKYKDRTLELYSRTADSFERAVSEIEAKTEIRLN